MPRPFLRNSPLRRCLLGLQCVAKLCGTPVQLLDDPVTVLLLIVVRAGIAVIHAIAHRVIKQDRDLARCRGDGLGIADAAGKASIKCSERGIAAANRNRSQSKCDGNPAAGFPGVCRQHLATADLASWREREPGSKMLGSAPATEVGSALTNQAQCQERPDTVDLGQVGAGKWYIAERTSKLGSLGSLLRCLAFGSGASGTGLPIFNPATARSISASHSSIHRW